MSGSRKSGHATGMAGEFFVMERLFRMGYEPALTLGNAKTVDILVGRLGNQTPKRISVKTVCGGGKWGIGDTDLSSEKGLVFVFLLYRYFDDLTASPDVWVMPAKDVEARKQGWLNGTSAIYYSGSNMPVDLHKFKDAWSHI